jgi:ferritin-like metal-binding protein YciE
VLTESARITRDGEVKDVLTSYAMGHFAIACYTALAVGAVAAGLPEVSQVCQQILFEEKTMAANLFNTLPQVVEQYVSEAAKTASKFLPMAR